MIQHRGDLAFIVYTQGTFSLTLRRTDEAERLTRRALEILEPIRITAQGNRVMRQLFCWCFAQLGRVEIDRGHPADARAWYQRTIDLFLPGRAATAPTDPNDRSDLAAAFGGRLRANVQLGRIDEALADWDRMAALGEPEEKGLRPLGPILVRAWSGDIGGFLVEARKAVEAGSVPIDGLSALAEAATQAAARAGADPALPTLGAHPAGWRARGPSHRLARACRVGGLFPESTPARSNSANLDSTPSASARASEPCWMTSSSRTTLSPPRPERRESEAPIHRLAKAAVRDLACGE